MQPIQFTALGAAPRVVALAGRWLGQWVQRTRLAQRYTAERRHFEQLDAATLRDLGVSRAEFDSYWVEALRMVPRTRSRLARHHEEAQREQS